MTHFGIALNKIQEAESYIHGLIGTAIRDGQFNDAKRLVDMVAALAALRNQLATAGADASIETAGNEEASGKRKKPSEAIPPARQAFVDSEVVPSSSAASYPKFERDGDRLVKIGWSAKDKRPYEHRVEWNAVTTISAAFADKFRSRRPIKVEKLLPVRNSDGNEIPSYQAYLVLKWLQQLGAIERRGKDGYVVKDGSLDSSALKVLWIRTPQRAH